MTYLIVGCGLSGAVVAERIARQLNKKVIIIDKRNHIGGNCYDYIDKETNILINEYGAHIFHTNNEKVWNYINMFSKWITYEHTVIANINNKQVPIPVNIHTVNTLFNLNINSESEMKAYIEKVSCKYDNIVNSEEMAKSRVGVELYEKLFKNYTLKQWNKYPDELDKSVLERIPVRYNYDNRYFSDKYQVLPEKGYTVFINNLLNHPNITIKLNTNFFDYKKENDITHYDGIIYTGPIDNYFTDLPKLEYRSINFEKKIIKNMNYYQKNSVINFPSMDVLYTRIVEYKHFLNQKSNDTIIVFETTTDKGEPYYPVPNKKNMELYEEYKKMALQEEKNKVYFLGRLANYKYINMDQAILNSLDFFDNYLNFKQHPLILI